MGMFKKGFWKVYGFTSGLYGLRFKDKVYSLGSRVPYGFCMACTSDRSNGA